MLSMTRTKSSDYGMCTNTVCNPEADKLFFEKFEKTYNHYFGKIFPTGISSSQEDQSKFVSLIEEAVGSILSKSCWFDVYWDSVDCLNRAHKRMIVRDPDNHWNYIVDAYADLSMNLVIPFYKRIWFKYFSNKTYFAEDREIAPVIYHRMRVWRTPNDRYDIQLTKCPMKHIDYLRSDYAKSRAGKPIIYRLGSDEENERIDYYCRRSLFGERVGMHIV